MDLGQQKRGFSLLYELFVRGSSDVRQIPYQPAKTACPARAENYFPRLSPEARGIESARVQAMLEELEASSRVNMHAITVLCDGAVIAEASAYPYDRAIPHVSHSMCKSLVGIAAGILHREGKLSLDECAYRYFDKTRLPSRLSARMRAVTVRHLLTMTSSVSFAEAGAATESDWVRAFFASDVWAEPGSEFAYNSMNSYILAAIVCEVTGMGLVEYLKPRLFEPLSISSVFWECCPMGIERGGWGLYIAQEDAAKLAKLLLDGGVFAGKRILEEAWVKAATTPQAITPADSGDYHYGYQLWCRREGGGFLFNGMLGQNVWVSEKNKIIVVTNAGNLEFFQKSAMLSIIEKHLGGDFTRASALRENKRALRRLLHTEREFCTSRAWVMPMAKPSLLRRVYLALHGFSAYRLPGVCRRLAGRRFGFVKNNCGILPVFVRLTQNNHTQGLRAVGFEAVGDTFYLIFDEGKGALYRIEVGFYGYAQNLLTVGGECYRVAAAGAVAVDEDGRQLLKVELCFPELSHSRRMKFYLDEETGGICLQMREVPGKEVLDCIFSALPIAAPRMRGLLSLLQGRINPDYLMMKVYDKFEPKLSAAERLTDLPTPASKTLEQLLEGESDK